MNSNKALVNFKKAVSILKGTSVVANDRRAAEASAIDFTVRTFQGAKIVRPSYGVSNRMQKQLTVLADSVNFIGGMPHYRFEVK